MTGIFHDTIIAYGLRFAFGSKAYPYPEEKDPSLWPQMLHPEKDPEARPQETLQADTRNPARFSSDDQRPPSRHSSHTRVSVNDRKAEATGTGDGEKTKDGVAVDVDPERADSDTILVDWYGPDDPENPQNWTSGKKLWVLFLTCLWTFTMYIGSSIFTAGVISVTQDFGVSQVAATLGLTLFVLGYGTGPMLLAPLSEIPQFGRMPIYIMSCALFTVLQVPTALATNFGMLLAFRFITGFVGSPILATGGATIADMYAPKKRAYGIGVWGLFAVSAPVMGPLVGGFAVHAHGWRWTIWELLWLSGFTLVVLVLFYPETSASNILYRRARRLRARTHNSLVKAQSEIDAAHMTIGAVATVALVRPFTLNFTEPIVLLMNLYISLIYALLYCWFESFPIVFQGIYGFREQLVGLSFLGILVGCILVIPPFFAYLYYYQEPRYNENGDIQPELHMRATIVGAFFIPICLFWFGWSSRESVPWIVPVIGSALFPIGGVLLFNSIFNYLTDSYPMYAASVLAGNDLMRSSFGAGFPLFAGAMYRNLGVGWASTLLGLLSCLFIPMPILLYKYGRRIRLASKRARHDI
ncbi:putative caffeine resistance protein 5 [Auriscalpium vulgare]|uniref:Caffeine resistance protein 5 n=1 Tax=Auriscalpium vulgare TaxID=40419 RepID=A0ACB8RMX6_9AGAM|nr:putative caffeine resistance protein 5 [Auriscalpium vulgare]